MIVTPASQRVPEDEKDTAIGLRYSEQEIPFGIYSDAITYPEALETKYTTYQLIRAKYAWEATVRDNYTPIQAELLIERSLVLKRLRAAAIGAVRSWLMQEADWFLRTIRKQINDGAPSKQP